MKIFLDTANLDELRAAAALGIVDGVTTNPSLIAKEGRSNVEQIRAICEIVDGDISAEVVSTEAEEMIREGHELAAIHPNVVVKCPLIPEGIKATKVLSSEGIRVNVTLCFSAAQALLAAKAGAYIVSPFMGRLDDIASEGTELIREIVTIYENYDFPTQVLAASVRGPMHVKGRRLGRIPHRHDARQDIPSTHQAPAYRHRPGAVSRRLQENFGGSCRRVRLGRPTSRPAALLLEPPPSPRAFTGRRLRKPARLPGELQEDPAKKREALRSLNRQAGEEQGSDAIRPNATGVLIQFYCQSSLFWRFAGGTESASVLESRK